MSTNLQKVSNSMAVSTIDDVARISKMFYDSGMFKDLQSIAQAGVKIMAGSELGITPFQSISGVHIIGGKPVIGAGLMASMVDRHPDYDFEVLQQDDKVCAIQFFKNGKVRGTSTFTAEDARKAGTQNMGKFPANMLYARAMSNGVKWYCPGVFAGPVYVPEEMQPEETVEATYTEVKAPEQPKNDQWQVHEEEAAPAASEKQMELMFNLSNSHHISADYHADLQDRVAHGMTAAEATAIIEELHETIIKGNYYEKNTQATAEQTETIEILLENAAFSDEEEAKGKESLAKGMSIHKANLFINKLEEKLQNYTRIQQEADAS